MGLTGSVAAGKSAVGRQFEAWGAARLDSDELAGEGIRPGSAGLARIRNMFGDDVLDSRGALDREAMRDRLLADPEAWGRLEEIVHAEVRELRDRRLAELAAAGASIVVEEIPLLFETGLEDDYAVIVAVDAESELRQARALASRGWDADWFETVESRQLAAADKRERADYVIVNDGDLDALVSAARVVWDAIMTRVDASQEAP